MYPGWLPLLGGQSVPEGGCMSQFRRFSIPKVLKSEGSQFRRFSSPKVLNSEGSQVRKSILK